MKNFDGKKKVILLSILGILLLIGTSYAIWQLNFTQESSNTLSVACFSITYSEQDNISLLNTYPMLDSEGASLTPYQVTIKNNCNEYGAYQVNLEVLNTTTLDSGMVKVMFDEGTPKLLTSYTAVEKTLSDATSAYKMTQGFLKPNEEKTYTLRLWVDENVTLEDNVEGKRFASKITISNTYKPGPPSPQEECELIYGEGASICNIIGHADPNNDKCLKVDENGMILYPDSTMSDAETPIICTMEDDYGTSYYLRGNHQDNNVKFANMCWKLMRITGTGGYKLIYNGDLDANGKCTTASGNHTGFTGQYLSLSGNKIYGASYTKEGNTYTLTDTSTLNWSIDSESILGKYTCGNTNSSCSTLYAVTGVINSNLGYVLKLDQTTNYAQIGSSPFNIFDSASNVPESGSPSYVGYMYNDTYPNFIKNSINSGEYILFEFNAGTSNYYYGDSISYSGGYYYITNQDGSNVQQLSWASNYENNLVGKYTCRGTSKYNDTTLRCSIAYKVLDTTTKTNYMIAEYLSGGRLAVGTIKLSNDFIDNQDGTYTLNSPITEISSIDWYNDYSSYKDYYACEDYNQTTCSNLYKIIKPSQIEFEQEVDVHNNYYYGSSFTYSEGNGNSYTLINTEQFWDTGDKNNTLKWNTHHYTCFNAIDNTCNELYYLYYLDGTILYYIKLKGNETGPVALNNMLSNDWSNAKNSQIKNAIDWWYEQKIKNTSYENYLEDTIFCNDRTASDLGGWSETGTLGMLKFNAYNNKYYLKCPNKRDAFTVVDTEKGNGALIYPVGMVNLSEVILLGNLSARATGNAYWSFSPLEFQHYIPMEKAISSSGGLNYGFMVDRGNGVRPSISLKPGTEFKEGTDGTASNPYEVE